MVRLLSVRRVSRLIVATQGGKCMGIATWRILRFCACRLDEQCRADQAHRKVSR